MSNSIQVKGSGSQIWQYQWLLARSHQKHDTAWSFLQRLHRSCLQCLLHMKWWGMFIWSLSLGSQLTLAPTLQVKMATMPSKVNTQRLDKGLISDNNALWKRSSDINRAALDRTTYCLSAAWIQRLHAFYHPWEGTANCGNGDTTLSWGDNTNHSTVPS